MSEMGITAVRDLPLALQTGYAELLDQLRTAALTGADSVGDFRLKTVKGRKYWYARSRTRDGIRSERYLGPDTPELRARVEAEGAGRLDSDDRRRLVRSLAAGGLPSPDAASGRILAALADAGVFRLRGVLVGTAAFQTYAGALGVLLPTAALRTGDIDLAVDYGVSVAIDDALEETLLDVLRSAVPAFRPVPTLAGHAIAHSFAARGGYRVDVLTTNRGGGRESSRLQTLRSDAVPLRFLDFLLRSPVEASVLHGPGILVQVPTPERYAVHKLIVSRRRGAANPKARKDMIQADLLMQALFRRDPDTLRKVYSEARERGPTWRRLLDHAVPLLSPGARESLG